MRFRDLFYDGWYMRTWFVITLIALAIFLIAWGMVALSEKTCFEYGEATGRNMRHNYMTCYVEYNGSWYTADEYQAILTGKNLKQE